MAVAYRSRLAAAPLGVPTPDTAAGPVGGSTLLHPAEPIAVHVRSTAGVMLMMDPSSPPAKLELKVRDIGLRVSPLPNDVRKRWLDWTAGSPPRSPSTLEVVEEKLQRAADRRKARAASAKPVTACVRYSHSLAAQTNRPKFHGRVMCFQVQQERIVQQARSRPRALQRVPSGSRRRAQEQALAVSFLAAHFNPHPVWHLDEHAWHPA